MPRSFLVKKAEDEKSHWSGLPSGGTECGVLDLSPRSEAVSDSQMSEDSPRHYNSGTNPDKQTDEERNRPTEKLWRHFSNTVPSERNYHSMKIGKYFRIVS